MKLNNVKNFSIGFACAGGTSNGWYPTLENCRELKIINVAEGINNSLSIGIDNSIECSINGNDEVAEQNLMKILPVIKSDHIDKTLEDLLNFEFVLPERLS